MSDVLQSSVVVSFDDDKTGALRWEQDSERTTDEDHTLFLRLYPAHPDQILKTSGGLSKRGVDYKHVKETHVFTGNREVGVGYVKGEHVIIQQVGTFYNKDGEAITVSFSFDAVRNVIRSSEEGYGLIKIRYDAPYQLYVFEFSGTPCKATYSALGSFMTTGGYSESTIVAVNFADGATANITLSPPDCGEVEVFVQRAQEAALPSLKIELNKDYPPKVSSFSTSGDILSAWCKVRVIPNVSASVHISNGTLTRDGTEDGNEQVEDVLTFSGSTSVNMHYQPSSRVDVRRVSGFWNKWGSSVSPSFAKPGDRVVDVDWLNEHTYKNPKPRIVGEDEIVAVGMGSKVIEVYGVVHASYSISFRGYKLEFDISNAAKIEDGFKNAHVIAFKGTQSAYLMVEPPTMKEG